MNSDFYIILKRVSVRSSDFPEALSRLHIAYNKLLRDLMENQLKNPEALKNYVIQAYRQINTEQQRIEVKLAQLATRTVESMSDSEAEEHETEVDYFTKIISISDDAKGALLEHIAAYYPEILDKNPALKLELKALNPHSDVTKLIMYKNNKSRLLIDKFAVKSYEKLFDAAIHSANEKLGQPIEQAYSLIKDTWFFLVSDNSTFNGESVILRDRPLKVNPQFFDSDFVAYSKADIKFDSMIDNIELKEQDFLNEITLWLERKIQINRDELQKRKYVEFLEFIKIKALPPQQTETKTEHETIEIKPVFKPETVQIVFDILKDFFSLDHQNKLEKLLETGHNTSNHLIFLDNGNRLADAFKQLKKADIITGCEQKELENWIRKNFKYRYRKEVKEYTSRYLNDIISTNKDKCQTPLLNVTIEKGSGERKITKA